MSGEHQERKGCLLPRKQDLYFAALYSSGAGAYFMLNAKNEKQFLLGFSMYLLGTSIAARDFLEDYQKNLGSNSGS